jgi:hypothetical protein
MKTVRNLMMLVLAVLAAAPTFADEVRREAVLYFSVLAPGASAAMYNSSMESNGTTITIPFSGKYVIHVYLMRNAARR